MPSLAGRRLLVAIIRRAVLDFVLYKDISKRQNPEKHAIAVDAAGWLFWDGEEEVDKDGRYSFLHLCSLLNFRPTQIRAQALELGKDDLPRFLDARLA